MFDIGFWELTIIAIIGLIVIGPERLPKFAHDAGSFINKIRNFVHNAKDELEKELQLKQLNELEKDINHIDDLMKQAPDRIILGKPDDDKRTDK
ncbi:MAG: twin-arginine translocase subunit TatB [Legionellales bacterium]|nr:twin-arginine translocase subunit TatB [Legionellales bacterium]|tara:strand:- start:604 stop:885 length:282 start_codon:yes stop_codon:yes gene_type:complete